MDRRWRYARLICPGGYARLPLMVAIIGGETHRFRPLVDLYREAGKKAGIRRIG